MVNHQSQATQPVASHNDERVAVLLASYGEVQFYRDLSRYNQAASKYIASLSTEPHLQSEVRKGFNKNC